MAPSFQPYVPEEKLVGVRGWLLFFCLNLTVINPVYIIYGDVQALKAIQLYGDRVPGLGAFLGLGLFADVVLIIYSIVAGVFLWTKPHGPKAVAIAKSYLRTMLGVRIVCVVLSITSPAFLVGFIVVLLQNLIYVGIWSSYLKDSKRVKATYLSATEERTSELASPTEFSSEAIQQKLEQNAPVPSQPATEAAFGVDLRSQPVDDIAADLTIEPIAPGRMQLLWLDANGLKVARASSESNAGANVWVDGNGQPEQVLLSAETLDWVERVNNLAERAVEAAKREQYDDAIEFYRAALRLAPGCDLYLMSIGCCLVNAGRAAEGLPYLERAARISPYNERIKRNLDGVKAALQTATA
ncbi:MAG: DUF2569 family protein [Acidobacteriota bacterium]